MIVYNITMKPESQVWQEWLIWLQSGFIPMVMSTQCFDGNHLFRILNTDDSEGPTYALQFHTSSPERYAYFEENHSAQVLGEASRHWGDRLLFFQTCMESVR